MKYSNMPAKAMLGENVVERASRKKLSRQRTIGFACTMRHSRCKRRPQLAFRVILPVIPLESHVKKLRDPTLGVEAENASPVVEGAVARHVLRALAATDLGVGEARLANPLILRTPTARSLIQIRVEVATGATTMDTGTEDMGRVQEMGMLEDIIAMIDHVALISHAESQSSSAQGKSPFVSGCNNWCTIWLSSMPRARRWGKS